MKEIVEKKIFLDTNALISLVNSNKLTSYQKAEGIEFVTFEKCLYEWKNGVKRYFIDPGFIIRTIKEGVTVGEKREKNEGQLIINRAIKLLQMDNKELNKLIDALKKFNLEFEFGVALEYQGIDVQHMEDSFKKWIDDRDREDTGLLRLKQFYKCIREELNLSFNQLDNQIKSYCIRVLRYDEVFGDPLKVIRFREMLNNAYLPTEDLEIIFAGLSSCCQAFVTADLKLIKRSFTLGLNHTLKFVDIKNMEETFKLFDNDEIRLNGLVDKDYN